MNTITDSVISRSHQACRACKQQKRRCDKGIPECSLCRRTGRKCEYTDLPDPPPTAAEFTAMRTRLDYVEERLALSSNQSFVEARKSPATSNRTFIDPVDSHSLGWSAFSPTHSNGSAMGQGHSKVDFPVALFLDIDCFVWAGMRLPHPPVSIPMDVLALLSQGNVVIDTSRDYFDTIHSWMPILSKKRMDLGILVQNSGPDLAMLFLAMKLVITSADEVGDDLLYSLAKNFLATLEHHGVISLLCLQAMVLVALYENSHAIYPAAWMTIGACARYADMLGLSCGGKDMPWIGQATTWTESEERRRVWWAIFILDRLVSMGSRRACSLSEPSPEGRLPVDDEAWDMGDLTRSMGHAVSTHYRIPQSSFARLCQAAIYVGRAVAFTRNQQTMSDSRIAELTVLADELCAFCAVMDNTPRGYPQDGFLSLLAPQCVARSALFITLDAFTCPEKIGAGAGYITSADAKTSTELNLQAYSINIIQQVSEQAHRLVKEAMSTVEIEAQLGKVSPFILHYMYCTIATFHWFLGENGTEAYQASIEELDMFLEKVGTRWKLAEKYIEIARFHNVLERTRNFSGR